MSGRPQRSLSDPFLKRPVLTVVLAALMLLAGLISLPALDLVWWRMLIVVAVLLAWVPLWRELRAVALRTLAVFAAIGVVVALHWLTFYGAIKLSNASVAASCMAVGPLFLAVIEPWIVDEAVDLVVEPLSQHPAPCPLEQPLVGLCIPEKEG